jgi:hypothetical protein
MATILNVPITTAVTTQVGTVYQVRAGPGSSVVPSSLGVQATLSGTAGTYMTFWLQFSYDDGISWCDALFGTVTPAAPRVAGVAVSSPSTGLAPAAVTDGGGSVTINPGIFSGLVRVKYSSTGTFTNGNLRVDTFGGYIEPSTG